MTDELVEELRDLPPKRTLYGRGPLKVFGYAHHRSFYSIRDKTIEAAGIERLTPHEAGRHGFATEAIVRSGIDVVTTARLGNWKDTRVLLERYVHPKGLNGIAESVFGSRRIDTPVTQTEPKSKKKRI